jgi:hypothetical protein
MNMQVENQHSQTFTCIRFNGNEEYTHAQEFSAVDAQFFVLPSQRRKNF